MQSLCLFLIFFSEKKMTAILPRLLNTKPSESLSRTVLALCNGSKWNHVCALSAVQAIKDAAHSKVCRSMSCAAREQCLWSHNVVMLIDCEGSKSPWTDSHVSFLQRNPCNERNWCNPSNSLYSNDYLYYKFHSITDLFLYAFDSCLGVREILRFTLTENKIPYMFKKKENQP